MFERFFKIDKSIGERRFDQISGAILLIAVFVFGILYSKGIITF